MAKINLDKMSLADLKTLSKDIDKAMKKAEQTARADAMKAVADAAQKHGFSLNELVGGSGKKASKAKAAAKYAHPENAALTWSGRGRQPAWIKEGLAKGKKLDAFLIA